MRLNADKASEDKASAKNLSAAKPTRQASARQKGWTYKAASVAIVAATVGVLGAVGAGCLTRPVTSQEPTTKTNFTANVRQQSVDKIDILFMIDNSASMGDKQELLKQAVPDLITRLITPNCVDNVDPNKVVGVCSPDATTGKCTCATGKPEFPPVHDMHIGIVTSSLGGRGSDACSATVTNPTNPALNSHNDDRGELINRGTATETSVGDAAPSNFLAWFPPVDANKGKPNPPVAPLADVTKLKQDFTDLVSGVHEYGCGFEAQLESWYRFLVQPDPFDQITRNGNAAGLDGVDKVILQQRHDFLRPDSLLAIIDVTDENEEVVDPLAVGGQGWAFEDSHFPGSPNGSAARGTSACDTNPNDPKCTSCGFPGNGGDPNCQANAGYYDPSDDQLNVRGFHQKQRFGIDPQFPLSRYINGLKSAVVPDRVGEHSNGSYVGTNNCSNPIFSTNLPVDPGPPDGSGAFPALCHLTRGPRTPDLVFFAVIGGVPHQLLQQNPADPNSPQKDSFVDADWVKIIGKDPINYDFTGVDPHMLESITPRAGLPPPGPGNGPDPINGREWDTAKQDLQYACTFPLVTAGVVTPKDCTSPAFSNACDCTTGKSPPLCDPNAPTMQIKGKAYPSIRELAVVRAMADQGIVSSLCPIHTTEQGAGDPLFGYRPAVKAIVDRLKNALANQCLPQALTRDPGPGPATGQVPCLILETLGVAGPESDCTKYPGLAIPDATILAKFRDNQKAQQSSQGEAGVDLSQFPVCQVNQLVGGDLICSDPANPATCSCAASAAAGWCYVEGAAAGTCPHAILFSPGGNPQVGSSISLQCIEGGSTSDGGGGGGGGGG